MTEEEADKEYAENPTFIAIKKVASVVNGISFILAAWSFVWPHPLELIAGLCVLYPILSIVLFRIYCTRSGLDIDVKYYPSIAVAVIMPAITLAYLALDFQIRDYGSIWIFTAVIGIAVSIAIFADPWKTDKIELKQWSANLGVLILCAAYGFGTSVYYNCCCDSSNGIRYKSSVISLQIRQQKYTYYYIEVEPWGPKHYNNSIKVDHEFYNNIAAGDSVIITSKPGRLGAAWFSVSKKTEQEN